MYILYVIYIIGPCNTAADLWYNNIRVYTGSSEFDCTQIVCGVGNCIKNHNKQIFIICMTHLYRVLIFTRAENKTKTGASCYL